LEQRIECRAPSAGEWMWGSRQIDLLPDKNVQFGRGVAETFKLRQVWMKIEGTNALQ
jgi:hypothetical protein